MKPTLGSNTLGQVVIGLNAVIFAAGEDELKVLVAEDPVNNHSALPFGPFDPEVHRTFEIGLREWVRDQTGFELGYVEQLYTFGDKGREAPVAALAGAEGTRVISVGYLGLTPQARTLKSGEARWASWSDFFPWEDHREGFPTIISDWIEPRLRNWVDEAAAPGRRRARLERIRTCFALDGIEWNEERALDRYELLYEANLAIESARDVNQAGNMAPLNTGKVMASDHRRILATALSRLRGKIKYRPVVFELMPEEFTLSYLQKLVESICGFPLHKQNFRRALDRAGFVEGTGHILAGTGGRPAELYRYIGHTNSQRPAMGLTIPRVSTN